MSDIRNPRNRKRSFLSENSKKKIGEKRLYIVLACCVVSIGAIYFANSIGKVEKEATESKHSNIKYNLPSPIETPGNAEQKIIEAPQSSEDVEKNDLDAEKKEFYGASKTDFQKAKVKEEQPQKDEYFSYPVNGEIILQYANKPTYSEAFDDWRTHEGVDIAAPTGSEVLASKSGEISKIFNDSVYGLTIAISHEDNIKTLYSNLSDTNDLKEGDKVTKGDVIAHTGESAIGEKNLPPHIHFEISVDNQTKNPSDFIK